MDENVKQKSSHDYLTNLYKRRSIIALCSGICSLLLSFHGIIAGVIRTIEVKNVNPFFSFAFFTMLSNTFATFSVASIIPYAVEGIKQKRFILPKWVAILHYLATTSIAIVFFFCLFFMSWADVEGAFGGSNFVLHVVCPILILISFFQIENGYIYTIKNRFIGIIPFVLYMIVYLVEVVFIGEANGGWPDIYKIQEFVHPVIGLLILLPFGLAVNWFVAVISNYLTKKRKAKMFIYWQDNVDPVEAKIEAFGLGSMMSKTKDESSMIIPLDILKHLSEKSNVKTDDLVKAYVAGLINEKRDKK